jgi:hypothetical protein
LETFSGTESMEIKLFQASLKLMIILGTENRYCWKASKLRRKRQNFLIYPKQLESRHKFEPDICFSSNAFILPYPFLHDHFVAIRFNS